MTALFLVDIILFKHIAQKPSHIVAVAVVSSVQHRLIAALITGKKALAIALPLECIVKREYILVTVELVVVI